VSSPLIIYVPGLLPKPEPRLHREALRRCLLAGVERIDADVAAAIVGRDDSFVIVPWTYGFYDLHRDIDLDRRAIEDVIAQALPSTGDIAEAASWKRRLALWVYNLGDRLPFLIPHLANERVALHLRDLRRYVNNNDGIADRIRQLLSEQLLAATQAERPILLIGHSMGSVIAYDTLWQQTHSADRPVDISLFLTMGSPLGQHYIQRRILGHDSVGKERFPSGIRRWKNLAAVGDLTAIDPKLMNDFGDMVSAGLLESLEDDYLFNYFRLDGELNVHAEYGYLVNEKTARTVTDWWRGFI